MGKRCVWVPPVGKHKGDRVMTSPVGHQRTLLGPFGSPTTKMVSSSAMSHSASPLTARGRGASYRTRALPSPGIPATPLLSLLLT